MQEDLTVAELVSKTKFSKTNVYLILTDSKFSRYKASRSWKYTVDGKEEYVHVADIPELMYFFGGMTIKRCESWA